MFRVPVVQRSASTTTRVARPAKGVVTLSRSEYRSIPLSRLEITLIEREKAHRQRVVRALIEGKRAVRPQPQQHTRAGRAQRFPERAAPLPRAPRARHRHPFGAAVGRADNITRNACLSG
jgi:hypothetical protein